MKNVINQARYMLLIAAFLLSACAQLGIPTPGSFDERLATGIGAVAQIRRDAAILVTSKAISPDDGQNIQDQADVARRGLEVARGLRTTDFNAAEGRLTATTAVLTALQAYLVQRKK
jgi:hypothetical protein